MLTERTDMTPEFVKQFVRSSVRVIAPFTKTEITHAELGALADFLAKC